MKWILEFLSGNSVWVYLVVFFGKLIEVTLASLRSQLIVKRQRLVGAIVSIFEYAIWFCITAAAVTGAAEDPIKLVLLIGAYALGQVSGSVIESKLALGYCLCTIIFSSIEYAGTVAEKLREAGQALTIFPAEGMEGTKRIAIYTTIKRKNTGKIKDIIYSIDDKAVIMTQAVQNVDGGTVPNELTNNK